MAFTDLPKVTDREKRSEEMRLKLSVEILAAFKRIEKEHNYNFSPCEKELVFLETLHHMAHYRLSIELSRDDYDKVKKFNGL